jgi:hypothetical protein
MKKAALGAGNSEAMNRPTYLDSKPKSEAHNVLVETIMRRLQKTVNH